MATGAVIARILTQYSDKGSKAAQKDIARLTKKFDDFGRKARKSFGIAIAATATLAIKIGKDAVEAAIEDSKSQLVLANALISVTGSQKQLTEAAEDYIKTTMLRVNVADEVLRASLATLVIATGDLTEAERLQGIALDVAASQGKDLATVTVAITKAQQGNLTSLKKLSPELSGLISKGMKAEEAFALLASTYGGSAEALADLDPLTKLKLAYGEVLETLGYELLPYVKEFVDVIVNDVLPVVDEWIKANGEDIGKAVSGFLRVGFQFLDLLVDIGTILEDNKTVIKWAFALLSIGKAVKFLGGVYKTFKRLRTEIKDGVKKLTDMKQTFSEFAGKDSGVGKAVTMIGNFVSNIGKLILLAPGVGIAFAVIKHAINALTGENDKLGSSTAKVTKNTYNQMRADQIAADAAKKKAEAIAKARAAAEAQAKVDAAIAAQRRKEEIADLKIKQAQEAKSLALKKQLNITKLSALDEGTETLIQLAAAEALLKKQGVIAKEEIAKLERLKQENFLLEARDTLAKRYLDIQEKLADQKLDTKEIEELSKKWGISNESVVAYIHLVKSVEDQVISADEIKTLADMWNTSESEAQKFLEVYRRIQDGLLDSNEVFDLIKQGFFQSEKEARIYADLVATVHDGIANDEDFEKLRIKWDLSKTQVNAYIAAMGAKFDYQGTFIDPVTLLKTQWDLATKALQAYLTLLNSGKGLDYNKFGPGTFTPGSGEDPAVIAAAKAAADAAAKAAADAAAALAESEAALAAIAAAESAASARNYAIAKAIGDTEGMMLAAAGVNPSALAAKESGAIGAASIAAQLAAAEQQLQNERIMSTYASFKAKEAADALASSSVSNMDYDEKFRFNRGTVATAQGISGGNLMAAPVVNITVQGSVTAEEDLVQTVRNGLLRTQYNGNSIDLQAI